MYLHLWWCATLFPMISLCKFGANLFAVQKTASWGSCKTLDQNIQTDNEATAAASRVWIVHSPSLSLKPSCDGVRQSAIRGTNSGCIHVILQGKLLLSGCWEIVAKKVKQRIRKTVGKVEFSTVRPSCHWNRKFSGRLILLYKGLLPPIVLQDCCFFSACQWQLFPNSSLKECKQGDMWHFQRFYCIITFSSVLKAAAASLRLCHFISGCLHFEVLMWYPYHKQHV